MENQGLDYDKNLSDLLDQISQDKEEMQQPTNINVESEIEQGQNINENEPIQEEPEEPEENIITDIPNLADLIVGLIDIGFNAIATSYTKNEDKTKYRLEDEEQTQLIKAWKLYLKNTPDFKMSPSSVLILSLGIVYAPKVITIFQDKKNNELERENKRLQYELERKEQQNGRQEKAS